MNYYSTDSNNNILQFADNKEAAEVFGLDKETEREIVYGYDGKLYFAGEEPTRPTTYADYDAAMESHLDAEKAERGYTKREPTDYATSTNPRFAQDAVDWAAHRDAVMEYGLEVENKAKAGEPVPTLDEFKANLPRIQWTLEAANETNDTNEEAN